MVKETVNVVYRLALKSGVQNANYTRWVGTDRITVSIQNGKLSSAWGTLKITLEQLGI